MKTDVSRSPPGLSLRAAARRVGCTHRAISLAVKAARIPIAADGTVQPADVDLWNAGRRARRGGAHRKVAASAAGIRATVSAPLSKNKRPTPSPVTQAAPAPINHLALADVLAGSGMFQDRASAELARDSYMARLRQLEYEERSGKLLDAERVRRTITSATTRTRSRLLAIPTENAPAIHRCKSAAEVQDLLGKLITRALDELVISFADREAP